MLDEISERISAEEVFGAAFTASAGPWNFELNQSVMAKIIPHFVQRFIFTVVMGIWEERTWILSRDNAAALPTFFLAPHKNTFISPTT